MVGGRWVDSARENSTRGRRKSGVRGGCGGGFWCALGWPGRHSRARREGLRGRNRGRWRRAWDCRTRRRGEVEVVLVRTLESFLRRELLRFVLLGGGRRRRGGGEYKATSFGERGGPLLACSGAVAWGNLVTEDDVRGCKAREAHVLGLRTSLVDDFAVRDLLLPDLSPTEGKSDASERGGRGRRGRGHCELHLVDEVELRRLRGRKRLRRSGGAGGR